MVTLESGVPNIGLRTIPAAVYHADPCAVPSLSSHCAATLITRSPAHAWHEHPRLGGGKSKTSKAKQRGSLAHELLLQPAGEIDAGVAVIRADSFRTKAAQRQRDDALDNGKVPVLEREFDAAVIVCGKLAAQLLEYGIRLNGTSEVAAFWQEVASDGTVVQCRGLLDHVVFVEGHIIELKTCRSAHPRAIQKAIEAYSYHIQCEAYKRALACIDPTLGGRVRHTWLFCELEPPYVIVPAEAAGSMRKLGESSWLQAVDTWANCLATNEWPSYSRGKVLRVEASPWALERALETEPEDEEVAA